MKKPLRGIICGKGLLLFLESGSGRRNVREDASGNFIDRHGLQDDPSWTLHYGIENPFSAEQAGTEFLLKKDRKLDAFLCCQKCAFLHDSAEKYSAIQRDSFLSLYYIFFTG